MAAIHQLKDNYHSEATEDMFRLALRGEVVSLFQRIPGDPRGLTVNDCIERGIFINCLTGEEQGKVIPMVSPLLLAVWCRRTKERNTRLADLVSAVVSEFLDPVDREWQCFERFHLGVELLRRQLLGEGPTDLASWYCLDEDHPHYKPAKAVQFFVSKKQRIIEVPTQYPMGGGVLTENEVTENIVYCTLPVRGREGTSCAPDHTDTL